MKTKIFLVVCFVIIVLASCKKEANDVVPSPWLAEMGTPVPDTVSCAKEVGEFVALFQALRTKKNNPPVFYDRRLIDLLAGEMDASACNRVDAAYYVKVDGKKKCGKFVTFYCQRTIESPEKFFEEIDRNPENYEEFTGNVLGRFFGEYDLFGVDLHKYTDGCLAGKYRMRIVVWVATDPH